MKNLTHIIMSAALFALPLSTLADDDDDERRHRHHFKQHHKHDKHHNVHAKRQNGYTKTYWDGNCKVRVKHLRNGGYQEKRNCMPRQNVSHRPVYAPHPNANSAPIVLQPGINIPSVFPFPY